MKDQPDNNIGGILTRQNAEAIGTSYLCEWSWTGRDI
jgi:hypothetical protein